MWAFVYQKNIFFYHLVLSTVKIEFTDDEAAVDNNQELLSEVENEEDKFDDIIDDSYDHEEGASFYREVDKRPSQFHNHTRNSHDAINKSLANLYKVEDEQPELFDPINRNLVTFDKFSGFEKSVENFKKTLKNFGSSDN